VVMSIFVIITGVIIADMPSFRDKTAIDLISQEIATTIRQAQVYGIGTREAGTGFSSYGTHFNVNPSAGGDKKSFILFADLGTPPDEQFTGEPPDKIIERFSVIGAAEIVSLTGCANSTCSSSENLNNNLDIIFKRFYPEASFIGGAGNFSYVEIEVQSTRDTSNNRSIQIWDTGQIVVKN